MLRRQQPPVCPSGESLLMRICSDSFLCNLRVILDLVVQVKRELFSFFASFFLFSKESGESPLTLRPNFNCEKGSVTAAAAACLPRRGIFATCNLRVILDLIVQVECELFSFFASFFLFSKESGESPLTLRPNFNCKKGSVTAAAAACMPRRGIAASRR